MPSRPDPDESRSRTAMERLEAARSLSTPLGALTHVSHVLQEIIEPESEENYALSAAQAALQLAEPEDKAAPWLYKEDSAPTLLASAVLAEVTSLVKDIEAFAGKRLISDPMTPVEAEDGAPTAERWADLVLTRWVKPLSALAEETIETPKGRIPWAAELFARFIESKGPTGAEGADIVRVEGALAVLGPRQETLPVGLPPPCPLWEMWLPTSTPPIPPVLRRLAYVLWWDRVRAVVEEARKSQVRTHAGIAMPLFERAGMGRWVGATVKDSDAGLPVLVDRHGVPLAKGGTDIVRAVPITDLAALEAWTRSGAELLGTVDAHRFLLWLVWQIHARAVVGGGAPVLEIVGGWSKLAEEVGARSDKAHVRLRNIVCALDGFRFALQDNSLGRLLALHYQPSRGTGDPAILRLTPSPPLLPGYVFELPRRERKMVPALRELPPMVGRERDHGAMAELHWLVLLEMRRRCSEMVGTTEEEDRGLPISADDWHRLAEQAGVPRPTLPRVLDRWIYDGDDGHAFLRLVEPDRYTLAPRHDPARRVLLHYGWVEAVGKEAGRKAADARAERASNGFRSRKKSS